MSMTIRQRGMRTELYFMLLSRHFPGYIAAVEIDNLSGTAKVTFKNNRELATPVENVLSDDFVAMCAMVYDL